jgi:Holliday junction resolvase-like predicted endonuclease
MSEDMTYEPVVIVRCVRCAAWEQLAANQLARIRDLEAQLNAAIVGKAQLEQIATIDDERRAKLWATAKHWQERAEDAERENTELRAKLDAVPVDAIRHLVGPSPIIPGRTESAWDELEAWVQAQQAAQP